jgi:hypothetical protein
VKVELYERLVVQPPGAAAIDPPLDATLPIALEMASGGIWINQQRFYHLYGGPTTAEQNDRFEAISVPLFPRLAVLGAQLHQFVWGKACEFISRDYTQTFSELRLCPKPNTEMRPV